MIPTARAPALASAALLALLPPCVPAWAQAPALTVQEEVIVTARRREESAQQTPVSLAVLDGDALQMQGITGIGDIRAQVPNFLVDNFPASNQTLRLFIRGVGVGDVQITQDPAVAVYLDGVYLARATGLATEVADLARVEILRGPQGTLFGRNTTGGALNLVTRRPDVDGRQLRLEAGVGSRDAQRGRAMLNLPLSQRQALKLSVLYDSVDGFIDNGGPGGDFGDRRARAYRLDWHWGGDDLALDYSWDRSDIDAYNYTPQAVRRPVLTGDPVDAAKRSSQRFVRYGSDRFSRLSTSQPLRETATDLEGHSLTAQWRLGEHTLKSITAWRELSDDSFIDFASGASEEYRVDFAAITLGAAGPAPLDFDSVPTRLEQEQFSQELQLFGRLGSLDYVAGLYWFSEDGRENWYPVHHIFSFPIIETGDALVAVNVRAEDSRIENEASALYTQWDWRPAALDERLRLSLGWRHSEDERRVKRVFEERNYLDLGGAALDTGVSREFRARGSRSFDDDSFSLMADYELRDDVMVYGKYVEAYKSGGFNTRDPDPDFFSRGFDAEKNRTVELGVKADLARALRLNGALFYSDFDDLQLNIVLPGSISDTRVFNSGSATLSGVELQLSAALSTHWLARLDYAYLDARIDDTVDPFTGLPRSFSFPNAPPHSATLNLDYRRGLGNGVELFGNLNANYVAEREDENPNLYRGAYRLLNAHIGLAGIELAGGELQLSAWARNALDEEYVVFAIDNLPHASRAVLWGEPGSWGLSLRWDSGRR